MYKFILLALGSYMFWNNVYFGLVAGVYLGVHYNEPLRPYKLEFDKKMLEKMEYIRSIPQNEPHKSYFDTFYSKLKK